MKNVFYIYYRNIYKTYTFCMGTIGFLIPKNMGIDIKICDSSFARGQVMAKYVISMAAILNVP